MSILIKESEFPIDLETLFSWHENEAFLKRLLPPWENIIYNGRTGDLKSNPKVSFKIKKGPFKFSYIAKHFAYEKNKFFADKQIKGPFKRFIHYHIFEKTNEKTKLIDKMDYIPYFKIISQKYVDQSLLKMLEYRHKLIAYDIDFFKKFKITPLRIGITGSNGDIGNHLINLLEIHGHEVVKLTRNPKYTDKKHYFWNVNTGEIKGENLKFDVIIHLAGESITQKKWSKKVKSEIYNSRVKYTEKLIDFLIKNNFTPKTFISASAIGYYGNRNDETLTEESESGAEFISNVCKNWEIAANKINNYSRLIILRIGVVISPTSGAFAKLLPYFKKGLGMVFGTGENFISWISMYDLINVILFCIYKDKANGVINATSTNPIKQKEYAKIIATTLKKPLFLKIPEFVIKYLLGEMGQEVLLTSSKVVPTKLIDYGFKFYFPNFEDYIKFITGKSYEY